MELAAVLETVGAHRGTRHRPAPRTRLPDGSVKKSSVGRSLNAASAVHAGPSEQIGEIEVRLALAGPHEPPEASPSMVLKGRER
jgi:hypothetical protein